MTKRTNLAITGSCWCALAVSGAAGADIDIQGDLVTISNANISLTLRGGDVVAVSNRLTKQRYAYGSRRQPPLFGVLAASGSQPVLRFSGWRRGRQGGVNPDSAQTSFNDLDRTVWVNVLSERETNDIVIQTWSEGTSDGVSGLQWALRNLDIETGSLMVPATRWQMPAAGGENRANYPGQWLADVAIWQAKRGGLVIYSRDDENRFKRMAARREGDRLDLVWVTEAEAPWKKASGVPHVEWRINAYDGDWRVPAGGYRSLMHFLRPPASATPAASWPQQVDGIEPVEPRAPASILDVIAKKRAPARTLLRVADWQTPEEVTARPGHEPPGWLKEFIDQAHARGFYVMVDVDAVHAGPQAAEFARMSRLAVLDPMTDAREGTPESAVVVNPAAREWRDTLVRRLRPLIEDARPDAILLRGLGLLGNDGRGRIEGKNSIEGAVALCRALRTAFPDTVLAADTVNELLAPYIAWCPNPVQHNPDGAALTTFLFAPLVRFL